MGGFVRSSLKTLGAVAVGAVSIARQKGAILLVVGIGALGLGADLLQFLSAGKSWMWISLTAAIVLVLLIFFFAGPILRRNARGYWLFSALRRTALVDVEHRGDREHRLPPSAIFEAAGQQPILVTGILDQLFQQHRDVLVRFVERGGHLRVLLVHPKKVAESLGQTWTRHRADWQQYWLTNCNEAQTALDGMIEAGLDGHTNFQVRFLTEIPPYFGMMVGEADAGRWRHPRPFVRVQPLAVSMFVGRGSVVTFEQIPGETETPFCYYAADLEAQWETALEDPDLVQERRDALTVSLFES